MDILTILILIVIFILWKMFVIIPMRESGIKERLGKFAGILQPGFHFLVPFIDRVAYRHEMREQVLDIPSQRCITRDNVEVEVDGLVYLKVVDSFKASYGIGNYITAAISLAQTTMRSEIGKLDLDDTFREREKVNDKIVEEIDKASDPWGIKFIRYEIRNIDPSATMLDTMEKQMEAERQKRADITLAIGERESRVNTSMGERQEAINVSEGEKQRMINEAAGRASEIKLIADATASGIARIAEAIRKPGGDLAYRTRLVEQYIEEFGKIVKTADISVVPNELANIKGVFEGIAGLKDGITQGAGK
ncbi:MAG: paraslipin [Leptospiraceae bacterium]|nr:paraslipin [Leptospiraceae bacterium]MCB1201193.1 paraslipin [Leptospiraceae bacterium]